MNNSIYNLEIFADLDKKIVDDIISNSEIEYYQPGEIILLQGDESNGKGYIIKSGEVKVDVNNMQVALLGVGDIFGEIALLNEEPRTATIITLTNVETIIISLDTIMEMISNGNSSINDDIMTRIEANLKNN